MKLFLRFWNAILRSSGKRMINHILECQHYDHYSLTEFSLHTCSFDECYNIIMQNYKNTKLVLMCDTCQCYFVFGQHFLQYSDPSSLWHLQENKLNKFNFLTSETIHLLTRMILYWLMQCQTIFNSGMETPPGCHGINGRTWERAIC